MIIAHKLTGHVTLELQSLGILWGLVPGPLWILNSEDAQVSYEMV